MAVRILLVGVGGVSYGLIAEAAERARKRLPVETDILVPVWREHLSLEAYDFSRMQWKAWIVNSRLAERYSPLLSPPKRLLIGVVSGDGFARGTNFVFGLATPHLGVASIYISRIAGDRIIERLTKLILHETGHLLGLGHCDNPRCVMHFSNSLRELDEKGDTFCPRCTARLKNLLDLGD